MTRGLHAAISGDRPVTQTSMEHTWNAGSFNEPKSRSDVSSGDPRGSQSPLGAMRSNGPSPRGNAASTLTSGAGEGTSGHVRTPVNGTCVERGAAR